jgi:hypothetical protein
MPKGTGWLSLVGFFGLVVAADAQTPLSQTAGSLFDGTYALVSSAVGHAWSGKGAYCPERSQGPLTIVQGQAQFANAATGNQFEGTVGSLGELAMRLISVNPTFKVIQPGSEVTVSGRIDRNGTVRAHTAAYYCSYDLVWQKEHK